ncbi:lantibiotic dehydratase [Flavobacterium jejuense]|uniref:Lantibiotic dehydratase n=1 Tax=Flavobacterium jejuense TaxID=1544455 RepID=A0ABX0IP92_9FLAO|nr:lantibiotic dehydratase [Flavobacterium jejuense]NHN25051.1 lantibiotic dehydratase [Flavobacterium jejuense]
MKFLPQFIVRTPLVSFGNKTDEAIFSEALYLSTPVLYDEYKKHIIKPIETEKGLKKLNVSLYKYESRASQRCTPFGLFAGLSIGEWKDKNQIVINSDLNETLIRSTRLDMNVLNSLVQELTKLESVKRYLKFFPNTSIYQVGENYRYIEYYYSNAKRFHKICKVDYSEYLEYILNQSSKGLTTIELINLLVDDEITIEEASEFIQELIDSQILINELEPTVTGADYFNSVLNKLQKIYELNKDANLFQVLNTLISVNHSIKKIDVTILNEVESYRQIHEQLKTILPDLAETNLFQTDLYKQTVQSEIDSKVQEQLKETLQFLNKITPVNTNEKLESFKKRFLNRFEDDTVPLLLALDVETGVGYMETGNHGINDLIEDVYIPNANYGSELKWNALQSCLLHLLTKSREEKKKCIEISEKDFPLIDFSENNLPSSFSAMFKLLDAETNNIYISGAGGSSAINLLGRFAVGNETVNEIVNTISKFEQEQFPNKILAEIVHLPESRTGNILARSAFRKYEIPYLAKSAVADDFQIKMEDLFIKIRNNKIILFDKRLQKEIIPRLGNAHNFGFNSLPVYHFLCDLQTQYFSKSFVGFHWGILANQFDFLPRVEYQNSILSAAKWQLKQKDLAPLQNKKKSNVEKHHYFFELKNKIELPDLFLIVQSDNELLIDTNNPIAVDTFIDIIKKSNEVILEEYLFTSKKALVQDTNNEMFTNECIAIVLNEQKERHQIQNDFQLKNITKQQFSIGSEWLYYKIYSGAKTADYILTEKIKKITKKLIEEKVIDHWFFIRYSDPETHLRFRLHIKDIVKYGYILHYINTELEPLINENRISKIQNETYKRELYRYGDNTIELAELFFYNDSKFVVEMLDLLDTENGGTIRWQMAIRSVDAFLDDFGFDLNQKYELIDVLSDSFFKEHGGQQMLKVSLNTKYRNLRKQMEQLLDKSSEAQEEYYPIIELIENRSLSNKPLVKQLLQIEKEKRLQVTINNLIASLLHMNLDRLFMGKNRTNEFVVYELLSRYYKGQIARKKYEVKEQVV